MDEERRKAHLGPPEEGERRMNEKLLSVVDDSESLSKEDLVQLKQMIKYWQFSKWGFSVIMAVGGGVFTVLQLLDSFVHHASK